MMSVITLGDLSIDRERYAVRVGEQAARLTYLEFELLAALAGQAGRVVPREELFTTLWGRPPADDIHRLAVHVSRLRKKIAGSRWTIQTVKKRGYCLSAPAPGSA
jgi:two-component system alkaline phosphatase synthesis response regulator PhoP